MRALIFMALWWCVTGNSELVQYIITCHTSDFVCFKRQYETLRVHVLTGNSFLGIDRYVPYVVEYGNSGTCVMVSGLEESELVGISMNSETKKYSLTLEMPFRMHQLKNDSIICRKPSQDFGDIEKHVGPLMNFTGNATVVVTYPYRLSRKKNGDIHLRLHPEEIDMTLDIPDLRDYDKENESQTDEYKWSEWAYSVSQHIDAAADFVMPYTSRLIDVYAKVPFHRFLILYPDELYTSIDFNFNNGSLENEFN